MKKEEFINLGLDEETAEKCVTAFNEAIKNYVPYERFKELVDEKNALKTSLKERDTQLEELKTSSGDIEALKKQIETLQTDNKAKDDAHAAEIKKMKIDRDVEKTLTKFGAINNKAVIPFLKGLEEAELNEDETVKGLTEQIEALVGADDTKFLFASSTGKVKGVVPGESGDDGDNPPDMSKMSYEELAAYIESHPDAV